MPEWPKTGYRGVAGWVYIMRDVHIRIKCIAKPAANKYFQSVWGLGKGRTCAGSKGGLDLEISGNKREGMGKAAATTVV